MATLIRDWIEQAAAGHGADLYLADARGPAALSYAGLRDAVADVGRRLDAAGLPPGARIVVRLAEPVEYATALVAIVASGRVAVPLDPAAPDSDVARVLGVAQPAAVIYRVDAVPGSGPRDLTGEATRPFGQIEFDFDVIDEVELQPRPGGGGIFLCTSGTTGTPKGILLREEQLAHVASSVVEAHRLGRGDRG
jgi:oxalate---CoA ligase